MLDFSLGKVGFPCFEIEIDDAVLKMAIHVHTVDSGESLCTFVCISKSQIYRYQIYCDASSPTVQPIAKVADECESRSAESLSCLAVDAFGEMVGTCEGFTTVVVRSEQLRRIRSFRLLDSAPSLSCGSKLVGLQFSGPMVVAISESGSVTVKRIQSVEIFCDVR